MLISALCDYYDVLVSNGKLIPPQFVSVDIHYLVDLSSDGKIQGIIDWQTYDKNSSKVIAQPRNEIFPNPGVSTSIKSYFIDYRPAYIFGLTFDKDSMTAVDEKGKTKKSHTAFVDYHLKNLEGIDDEFVNAFRKFITNWEPEAETNNAILKALGKQFNSSHFGFCMDGKLDRTLHTLPLVLKRWQEIYTQNSVADDKQAYCPVMGVPLPVERIHPKIKGVIGGKSTGTALVSFNSQAEESYGKKQSFNSNLSKIAADRYTTALNYLLSSRVHRTFLDGVTIIHWAADNNEECDKGFNRAIIETPPDEAPDVAFDDIYDNPPKAVTQQSDAVLKKITEDVQQGIRRHDVKTFVEHNIADNTPFYIVGIKPNAARLSVKFIFRNSFGKIMRNIDRHVADMEIGENRKSVPLWRICKELVSPKSSEENVNPALMANLFSAVVNNTRYPNSLLTTLVRRVRTDSDTETNSFIQMNPVRMGMIKACINRNLRINGKEEEITVALNTENKNPAYLCGRLFSILEDIQQQALGYNLNRTIKDAYFSSACVRPATVFPRLLLLSQHHMAKLKSDKYSNEAIMEITDSLNNVFPLMLSIQDQGIFMLGYYQQKSHTIKQIKEYKEKNNG